MAGYANKEIKLLYLTVGEDVGFEVVKSRQGYFIVVNVTDGSPSYRAGIRKGQQVMSYQTDSTGRFKVTSMNPWIDGTFETVAEYCHDTKEKKVIAIKVRDDSFCPPWLQGRDMARMQAIQLAKVGWGSLGEEDARNKLADAVYDADAQWCRDTGGASQAFVRQANGVVSSEIPTRLAIPAPARRTPKSRPLSTPPPSKAPAKRKAGTLAADKKKQARIPSQITVQPPVLTVDDLFGASNIFPLEPERLLLKDKVSPELIALVGSMIRGVVGADKIVITAPMMVEHVLAFEWHKDAVTCPLCVPIHSPGKEVDWNLIAIVPENDKLVIFDFSRLHKIAFELSAKMADNNIEAKIEDCTLLGDSSDYGLDVLSYLGAVAGLLLKPRRTTSVAKMISQLSPATLSRDDLAKMLWSSLGGWIAGIRTMKADRNGVMATCHRICNALAKMLAFPAIQPGKIPIVWFEEPKTLEWIDNPDRCA